MQSSTEFIAWTKRQADRQPRALIFGGMLANLLVATVLFGLIRLGGPAFRAELARGYPAELLMVRNLSGQAYAVTLQLDGRFEQKVELQPGVTSFRLNVGFADTAYHLPPENYRPSRLRIVGRGWSEELRIPEASH